MYKKAMSCLVLANLLFLFGFLCILGVEESRASATTAFEIELDARFVADSESSTLGIASVAVSGQRVVDCDVVEKELEYYLGEEDLNVLLRIVEAEAGGEDIDGKLLVANVVLNRVDCVDFPDTVKEVVFQRDKGATQFSPVANGRYYTVEISEDTYEAVEQALEGENISQGALYFAARKYADSEKMRWFDENLTFLFQHGGHEFFK